MGNVDVENMSEEIKEESKDPKEIITKAYDQWDKAVDTLIEQANISYMPLVSSTLKLTKEVLAVYRKAFLEGVEKEK